MCVRGLGGNYFEGPYENGFEDVVSKTMNIMSIGAF